MCSISGIFDVNNNIDAIQLEKFNEILRHRGPDSSGVFIEDYIGLAHTRLSILDLSSSGNQPMHSSSKRFVLVYNGEVYNHLDIRKEKLSHIKFRGGSDTETLVELLAFFIENNKGLDDALSLLNGMFAFAIWDRKKKWLFIARDRMGIKPLYICKQDGKLFFSSEIKALLQSGIRFKPNKIAIQNYFTYGHSRPSATIYEGITKLEPGTFIAVDLNKETKKKYWSLCVNNHFNGSYNDAKDELSLLLDSSSKMRLIADVPVGAFLSGGIDSSAIVSLIQKHHGSSLNTFSVGFNVKTSRNGVKQGGKYSELNDAQIVAKQMNSIHHEIIPTSDDLIQNIEDIVYHYDEPFGDQASFPTYMVSQLAKKYVTVSLSGDGADELFGGYRRYKAHMWKYRHKIASSAFSVCINALSPLLPRIRRLRKIADTYMEQNEIRRYSKWLETLSNTDYQFLTGNEILYNPIYKEIFKFFDNDISKIMFIVDQSTLLVDGYLEKVDKASMAHSLEVRVPFLDHRIVEFANSLPIEWKINGTSKKILKDSLRTIIPDSIIDKPKRGFAVPIDEWFRNELSEYLKNSIFDETIPYGDLGLNFQFIKNAYNSHINGKKDYAFFLWQTLFFAIWVKKYNLEN